MELAHFAKNNNNNNNNSNNNNNNNHKLEVKLPLAIVWSNDFLGSGVGRDFREWVRFAWKRNL